MLDLVLTNKEGLVGNVKIKSSLGCGDHEKVEFNITVVARRAHSKLTTLDFVLFMGLLAPWDKTLKGRRAPKNWMISYKTRKYTSQQRRMPSRGT